jgi:hypothetical protein
MALALVCVSFSRSARGEIVTKPGWDGKR